MCVNVSKARRIIKGLRPCQCENRDIDKTLPGHWWYEKQFLWPFGLKLNVKDSHNCRLPINRPPFNFPLRALQEIHHVANSGLLHHADATAWRRSIGGSQWASGCPDTPTKRWYSPSVSVTTGGHGRYGFLPSVRLERGWPPLNRLRRRPARAKR